MTRYIKLLLLFILFFNWLLCNARAQELLTWQDCVKEAARNHPDLISAEETVKQSEASKKITASSLLPQVAADLSASRAQTSAGKISTTSDTYSYGASATQLIFDGTKTINNVRAANENINVAKYNYKFTSSEIRFRLRSAFINLLKSQELLNVTEEIFKIRRNNYILITLRYQSGMEHRGALLTVDANLAEANFEIAQAKRGLEAAQRQLLKEMGRDQFSPIKANGDFSVKSPEKEKPDFEAIVKSNPSLQGLVSKINQANFSLLSSYDNFFPELSAQAGSERTGSNWPARNKQWNLGLTLSFPIFEGGSRFAQISQAESVLNQAKANERSSHDSLVLTLEQTWVALQDTIEILEVQKKFLVAAQERAKIAEAQYSTGFITYDNWNIIENDLVNTKKSFLTAQANSLLAEANWIQAKGETLEYEN